MFARFLPEWIADRLGEIMIMVAKVALWIQVIMALIASTGYAYTSIHGSAVAVAIAGLIALETGTKPYIRLYSMLLVLMLGADLMFLSMWSVKIAKNDSSVVGEYNAKEFRDSEKFSLSAVFICFFVRLGSVPIWAKFLYASYTEANSSETMLGSGLLSDEA